MNRKTIKYFVIILAIIITIIGVNKNTLAAVGSFSVSAGKNQLDIGGTTTLTISTSNCAGKFSIVSSNSNVVSVSSGSEWVEGSSSVTLTAKNSGTATITVSASDVADTDEKDVTDSKSVTITVKEKETPKPETTTTPATTTTPTTTTTPSQTTTPSSNTNKNTNNNSNTNSNNNNTQTKPQEPTFTSTSQTVYSASEGINIRSSYSTSSSVVGSLKKGESVTRIGVGSNGWSKVKYNGTTAYIKTDLLTTTKPEEKQEDKKDEEKKEEEDKKTEEKNEEEKKADKSLKSLEIAQGVLSPEFNPETTQYEIDVDSKVEKLEIKAVPNNEKATVSIQGNEDLKVGENTVKIVVTAENQTARTYNIIVKKSNKEALALSTLKIEGITLSPKFSPSVYEYKADLTKELDKLNIEAKCNDADAVVEILGNEKLKLGENIITIMIKSKDGEKSATYQIMINKKEVAPVVEENQIEEKGFFEEFGLSQMVLIGIGVLCVIILIAIIVIIRKIIKEKNEDDIEFGFMDDIKNMDEDNNYFSNFKQENDESTKMNFNEEFSSSIDDIKDEENEHKLYNVENEPDFKMDDIEEEMPKKRGKRKGKHSK